MKLKCFVATICIIFCCLSCQGKHYKTVRGEVFGTYYSFQIDSEIDFTKQIDSIFQLVNRAANSYDSTSKISDFNREGILHNPSTTFLKMLEEAKVHNELTNGFFEPTLYPLINSWGFGFKNREKMDSIKVDSLLKAVSFAQFISFDTSQVTALKEDVQIDLSGLGEGFTLDAISEILDNNNIKNYLIEIGGEMKGKGVNSKGKIWVLGIENPTIPVGESGTSLMTTVELKDGGLSTSGNYRKFYTDSLGNKLSHIIDPKTGFPVRHNLLSVSIISKSSTTADAVATACMAMGTEQAIKLIEKNQSIEGFLVFSKDGELSTWNSKNFFNY